MNTQALSRRNFLHSGAVLGAGAVALRLRLQMAAVEMRAVAPAGPHFPSQAKWLIMVFLTGGGSHVDTFDEKPLLARDHGKVVAGPRLRGVAQQPLQASTFKFNSCGQSGLRISELFPHLGGLADDLCIIRTLHTDIVEHFQAALAMHTGSATVPLPSLGAWLSYGLASDNANLPPNVVLCEHLPYGGSRLWDSQGDMQHHRPKAQRVDQALTALLWDLKQRGLFDETLVAICTEFGRTPFDAGKGRNHWHRAFSCLLSGAGVRGGLACGESDEYGIEIARDPVHVHDYHATILHLMGIDHERRTYRCAGRSLSLILLEQIRLGLERGMHRMIGQVNEERPVALLFDKLEHLVR